MKRDGISLRLLAATRRFPFAVWLGASTALFLVLFAVFAAAGGGSLALSPAARLAIVFPLTPGAALDPLVVTGEANAGDLLGVKYPAPGMAQFQYDSWGRGSVFSATVPFTPGARHELEVRMPSLGAVRPVLRPLPNPAGDVLTLRFDGREILRQSVPYYWRHPAAVHFGQNPFSGTLYAPRFSGRIDILPNGSARRLPLVERMGWAYYLHPYGTLALLAGCSLLALLLLRRSLPEGFLSIAWQRAIPWLVCVFVCLPLADVSASFYLDWLRHLWVLAYNGVYWAHHHQLPAMLHTAEAAGMPHNILYGGVFFGLLAIPSSVIGPDLTMRLAILAALLVQYRAVRKTVFAARPDALIAHTTAIAFTCAIYTLTNIYQRTALPEFFAASFLTVAFCALVRLSLRQEGERAWPCALELSLSLAVVLITHPITAVLGGAFLGLAVVILAAGAGRRWVRFLTLAALSAAAAALPSLPSLYASARLFHDMDSVLGAGQRGWRLGPFDSLWARLSPFPFDPRSLAEGVYLRGGTTPYIDLQVNVPLLLWGVLLLAFAAAPPRRRAGLALAVFGAAAFAGILAASVLPSVAAWVPQPFAASRYAYRLITCCNLSSLALVLGAALLGRAPQEGGRPPAVPAAIVLTLSLSAVLIKLPRAEAVMTHESAWNTEAQVLSLPERFSGLHDFTSTRGLEEIAGPPERKVHFQPRAGAAFGRLEPVTLELDAPRPVVTNVIAFPWSRITLDGTPLKRPELKRSGNFLAFRAPAGRHTAGYLFTPDPTWLALQKVAGIFGP